MSPVKTEVSLCAGEGRAAMAYVERGKTARRGCVVEMRGSGLALRCVRGCVFDFARKRHPRSDTLF